MIFNFRSSALVFGNEGCLMGFGLGTPNRWSVFASVSAPEGGCFDEDEEFA